MMTPTRMGLWVGLWRRRMEIHILYIYTIYLSRAGHKGIIMFTKRFSMFGRLYIKVEALLVISRSIKVLIAA